MRDTAERDLQIDREPASDEYLHIHYHPLLPDEVRIWVNGERIRLTLEEVAKIREFFNAL